jgi:hypothetical protein
MTTIILAILAILVGALLSITGFSVIGSVDAQMTGDNATMSGNMTGGNVTGGNTTGSISSFDESESESDESESDGGTVIIDEDGSGGCIDC